MEVVMRNINIETVDLPTLSCLDIIALKIARVLA